MHKKINFSYRNILYLFFAIFSLFFFTQPIYAQPARQWTFMVYMDGDNNLENAAKADFTEMANIGSDDDIAIVVLFDGASSNDSRWGLVTKGDVLNSSWGSILDDSSEVDMGDSQTLANFVEQATYTYPAPNYALILWDHGDGWREKIELLRNQLRTRGNELSLSERENILNEIKNLEQKVQQEHAWKSVCVDNHSGGDALNIREIREAFKDLYDREVITGVELIGFDACLMGMLEVGYEVKDYAKVMVASEKTEPLAGWPYNTILSDLTDNPTMTPEELGTMIVQKYGEFYISNEEDGDQTLSAVQLQEQLGGYYSASDLQDTWLMHSLESSDSGDSGWEHAKVNIDGSGNMTFTSYLDSEEDTEQGDAPDTMQIDPSGIVTVNDDSFYGVMSQDKSIVVGTAGDEDYQLIILQRSGGETFAQTDLQGIWKMHSLRSGGGADNSGWSYGTVTIDPVGNMVWSDCLDSEGDTEMDDAPDTALITSGGIVSLPNHGTFHGVMSLDKNTVVGTMTSTGEGYKDYELIVLQRSGGTFAAIDFKGIWNMNSLESGDVNNNGWSRGTVNIDNSGNMTWISYLDSDGDTSIEGTPNTVSITPSGIVTVDTVDNDTTFHGVMSLDKSIVFATVGAGEGHELIVLQKSGSMFATIATLAHAVSIFAQTALETEHDDWDVIFAAQQRAGYYEPYFSYRDLRGFMEGVADNAKCELIQTAAQNVITAIDGCVIANHSSIADKGNGLSIYFPEWFWGDENLSDTALIDPDYNDTNLLFLKDEEGVYKKETKLPLPYMQYWDEFLYEYVDTSLVPNHTGTYTYSRTIPGGTTASAYVMISSPVLPSNLDPFANLQDDLGVYDRNVWRLFRWNPIFSTPGYQEYPFPEYDVEEYPSIGGDVVPSNGYWLISRNTVDIDVTGLLAETNRPYPILLYPGWNQIGTPFNFDIDFDTVWVFWSGVGGIVEKHDRTIGLDLDLIFDATSSENVYTSRTLWKYENGDYSATAVMNPGEGYWINNLTDDYVLLVVNPVRSTLSERYIVSLERTLTALAKSTEKTPPPPPGGIDPEPNGEGSSSGKSGCFIATACFGSPMAGEVQVLRNFRDKYLLSNSIGQVFVSLYYRYSPPVARFIGNHKFLRVMVRSSLYPIVKWCNLTIEDK